MDRTSSAALYFAISLSLGAAAASACQRSTDTLQGQADEHGPSPATEESEVGLEPEGGLGEGAYTINAAFTRARPSRQELMIAAAHVFEMWRSESNATRTPTTEDLERICKDNASLVGAQQSVESQHKFLSLVLQGESFSATGTVRFESGKVSPLTTLVHEGVHYQHVYTPRSSSAGYDLTVWIEEVTNSREYRDPVHATIELHVKRASILTKLLGSVQDAVSDEEPNGSSSADKVTSTASTQGPRHRAWRIEAGTERWAAVSSALRAADCGPANAVFSIGGSGEFSLTRDGNSTTWRETWTDATLTTLVEVVLHWENSRLTRLERRWYLAGSKVVYLDTRIDVEPKPSGAWPEFDPATADRVYDLREGQAR